jgi:hypothetical protein
MSHTTSEGPLREQVTVSVAAVAAEIQNAVRQEIDALRGLISTRLGALERSVAHNENDSAFDPIIQQLCAVADAHADATTSQALAQVAETTERERAVEREQAHAELEALRAQSEATRLDLEQRLAQAVKATAETDQAFDALRAESDAARVELERRLAEAAREKDQALLALTEADRAAAAARDEKERYAAHLDEARARIDAVEEERGALALARDIANAHLEGELHKRLAIAAELEAARETALQINAEMDACRLELRHAAERIRILEGRPGEVSVEPPERPEAVRSGDAALLDQVSAALHTLAEATGPGLLDALLDLLLPHFSRVAICAVGPRGCSVWSNRGFEPPLRRGKAAIPSTLESSLTRASADWATTTVRASVGEEMSGLAGDPIGYAIALPILAREQGAVMLYAENPPESLEHDLSVASKIAAILADQVRRRLRLKQTAPEADAPRYSPERQARRIKIQGDARVAVNGAPSTLVDLSLIGAQVLSSRTIKPNQSLSLGLPSDKGRVTCKASVAWVTRERSQDNKTDVYRAGVRFVDANAPELDAFFSHYGVVVSALKH